MMRKQDEETLKINKKNYITPLLNIVTIEMEEGIASGSATTLPSSPNGQIREEWETAPDEDRPFEWS
ncbi:hypothetical protein [Elizabethkingia anophelis]|uniref:hypothetical protein n=1 Tax=Elizabethkingia anophelis TaxID=1117645 RepID=UPI0021A98BB8|nr:hypothetical protein [Elizabethkingia anophelis]